jgi:hypothetical protein
MTTFDLRSPALREQFGLHQPDYSEIVSKLSQWRKESRPYRDRAVSRNAVLLALRDAAPVALTRLEIARAIQRAKGPTVVNALNDLMADGLVTSYVEPYRNSGRYVYVLSAEGALYARALS